MIKAKVPFAVFGALLGAAGLPLYIHAPKYFVDTYDVSLTALGAVLFGLRLLDVVQDPLLGRLVSRAKDYIRALVIIGATLMVSGMIGLFAISAPMSPILWFALTLAAVFTGFSLLTIILYSQCAILFSKPEQIIVARWRETGQLLGICLAAIAPTLLATYVATPFSGFALGFLGLAIVAVVATYSHWTTHAIEVAQSSFATLAFALKPYLLLGFLNAAPVAITSTLFLFFVEYRLGSADLAGPLLVIFFLSAAVSSPLWSYLAQRFGIVPVLLAAMIATLISFVFAFGLGTGSIVPFIVICIVTGATTGADMTLMPVFFTNHLKSQNHPADISFGLWSFASKLALAFAAILVLPALELTGFDPNALTENGLLSLSIAYAIVPSVLKVLAIYMMYRIGKYHA